MAKTTKKKSDEIVYNETIIERPMEEIVPESMMPYAEHVILERAIPRVEDGLKPVQRRVLFTMHEDGLTPDKAYKKCATEVGNCMGRYHPHGDSSVYDALARLAQPFNMRGTLVDGHGNFGSVDGDRPAAMRYTECRMAPLALELLADLEKDTVSFSLNFDDTLREPDMFPGGFPNLLVNGASGIAVGLATNILPHNLGEAVDAVIAQIDKPDITTAELLGYLHGPDFPTGGIIVGGDSLESVYETGRGKILCRAKTQIEPGASGRKLIVITEIPYQVNKAQMLADISRLTDERKALFGGIYDIRDESDRTGTRAVIELRRDADPDKILAALYKYSALQTSYGMNMVAIADGKPMLLGLRQINAYYIAHRKRVVTRAAQYDLDAALSRMHIVEGLIVAVDNIDEVIRIIRSSKSPKEAREGLIIRFAITEVQAQAILDLRLQRLTGLEVLALRKELAELEKTVARLEGLLKSEKKLFAAIKEQLLAVKTRHADPRRTVIMAEAPAQVVVEPVREALPCVLAVTCDGFLKRVAPKQFVRKEEDAPLWRCQRIMSDWRILLFTDRGACYTLAPEQIPECRLRDRGAPYVALLAGLEEGERVIELFAVPPEAPQGEYIFFTERGMAKRTACSEYGARRGKASAITLKGDDRLVAVEEARAGEDVFLLTSRGMALRAALEDFPITGRATAGVRAIAAEEGDALTFAAMAAKGCELVIFTDRGYAKRCPIADFDRQRRGGKGVRAIAFTRNGANGSRVACALMNSEPERRFTVFQKGGEATGFAWNEILAETRASKGSMYVMVIMDHTVERAVFDIKDT